MIAGIMPRKHFMYKYRSRFSAALCSLTHSLAERYTARSQFRDHLGVIQLLAASLLIFLLFFVLVLLVRNVYGREE